MFNKTIIDSDAFLDMPLSTQALYFHLSMRADDDGFLNNSKKIMRLVGANQNDYDLLLVKKFIIQFEDGICVIKHWRIHNYIKNDRYRETMYKDDKNMLNLDDNKAYTLRETGKKLDGNKIIDTENKLETKEGQSGDKMETQVRLELELELGKDSIDNIYEEVIDYLNLKTGKAYKSTRKDTQKFIRARQNEGFTLDDFKKVIDNKVADSKKGKFDETYLRPQTLFGNKFEGYLNQGGAAGGNWNNKPGQNTGKYAGIKTNSEVKYTDEELEAARKELI